MGSPRERRRLRPRHQPVRRRPGRPDLLARDDRGAGAARDDPDHQRPVRRVAPVPGAWPTCMTIEELSAGSTGSKLVFVGDGNNVARSLAVASALLGVEFVLASPAGLRVPARRSARRFAERFPSVPLGRRARPAQRPSPAPTWSTPTSGRAWARSTRPTTAARPSRRSRSNEDLLARRAARRDLPALPPRPPRRGGDLGRARRPAQPGHPPGRQPAPLPEGAAALAAGSTAGRERLGADRTTDRTSRRTSPTSSRRLDETASMPRHDGRAPDELRPVTDRARLRPQQPRERALPGGRDDRRWSTAQVSDKVPAVPRRARASAG